MMLIYDLKNQNIIYTKNRTLERGKTFLIKKIFFTSAAHNFSYGKPYFQIKMFQSLKWLKHFYLILFFPQIEIVVV